MRKDPFIIRYATAHSEGIKIKAEYPIEAALAFYMNDPREELILVESIENGTVYEFTSDDLADHFPDLADSIRPPKKSYVFQSSLEETEYSPEAKKEIRNLNTLIWALLKFGPVLLVLLLGYFGIYYHAGQDNGEIVRQQFNDFAISLPEAWNVRNKTYFQDGTSRVWLDTIHTNQLIIYAVSEDGYYQNYHLVEEHRKQFTTEQKQESGRTPTFGVRTNQVHFGRDFMVEPFVYKRRLGTGSGRLMVARIAPRGKEFYIVMILQDDYLKVWTQQLKEVMDSISPLLE